jgi:hypothetical protein
MPSSLPLLPQPGNRRGKLYPKTIHFGGLRSAHLEPLSHAPTPPPATLPAAAGPDQANISITSATYGLNCGASIGNTTERVGAACDGRASCRYIVNHKRLGDPAALCAKDFTVEYRCQDGSEHEAKIPAEAGFGAVIEIECKPTVISGIDVRSATYGGQLRRAFGQCDKGPRSELQWSRGL